MLRFFRLNDPYRLLVLLLILFLFSLPILMDPIATIQELKSFLLGEALNTGKSLYIQLIDDTAPFSAWFFKWLEALFGRSLTMRHLLALVFIFFQASFFGILLINNKAYNENTYLPSLVFGTLAFYSFDMLSVSPELLASTALLFALNNLFKEIEFRVQRDEIILNLGVYLGVASLFVFSYIVFLLGTLAILMLFTRVTVRKAFLLLFGFVLPHAIIFLFYFFWDNQSALVQYFYLPNLTLETWAVVNFRSILVLGIVPILYFVLSLFMVNLGARFTKYQSQLLQVMFLWLLVAATEIIATRVRTPHSFFTFVPPITYFISHYLLLIRRKKIAEIMLWIFLVGLLAMSWASRKNRVPAINLASVYPSSHQGSTTIKEKRVLVLGNELGVYYQNKMVGYFLNWELSKGIFEHPEFFENVILVDQCFQQDPPDVIIDKQNLLQPFLEKIPRIENQFRQQGDLYYRINN
ncbi:MAG: hypothetical protein ORN54_15395 [Cyclobacteriaceae bacterium]|nr:hypothetical protein [Cyclobacteriaceae bacterium]